MTDWNDGYVTDIQYTGNFYRELSPTYLSFVALVQGYHPPRLGKGANYCELGCGQGVGTAILAAANPAMNFWGIDFNPGQIANAQRYAEAGGLTNITFLDHSFQQSVEAAPGVLPQFDFIVLHGIYSWVSPENRDYVVRFIDRYLKPGGLVFVSYNCMPGWAVNGPIQRLVKEHAKRNPGRSDSQAEQAFGFLRQMMDSKAKYFSSNPRFAERLERMLIKDNRYLAHEYLNAHWHPMYHADVVDELQAARLNFIGSATLPENINNTSVPASMVKMIEQATDPVMAETLRDYAANKQFRRDVFIRGASRLSQFEHAAMLNGARFSLMTPRAGVSLKFTIPLGEMTGNPAHYDPLLDALANGPKSFRELNALQPNPDAGRSALLNGLTLLVHSGQVHPLYAPEDAKDPTPARRFNKASAAGVRLNEPQTFFALPIAGTGLKATYDQALIVHALNTGIAANAQKIAEFGWDIMERTGRRLKKDGVTVQDREASLRELERQAQTFLGARLSLWKTLGII